MHELFDIFSELEHSAEKFDYESVMSADKRLREAVEVYFSGRQSLTQTEKNALQTLLHKHDGLVKNLQKKKDSIAEESQNMQRSEKANKQYMSIKMAI